MANKNIGYKELEEIGRFIQFSVIEFRKIGQRPEDLLISMPRWLHQAFRLYRRSEFSSILDYDNRNQMFFGVETQPHFKDEVVVFIEHAYTCPAPLPKFHTINFEVFNIEKK